MAVAGDGGLGRAHTDSGPPGRAQRVPAAPWMPRLIGVREATDWLVRNVLGRRDACFPAFRWVVGRAGGPTRQLVTRLCPRQPGSATLSPWNSWIWDPGLISFSPMAFCCICS